MAPVPKRPSLDEPDSTRRTVRVFAVDDHPAFLRSVASVIAATTGFELVGTALTGNEAIGAIADVGPVDLVLVDVHLPDISGIEVARVVRAASPRRTVVLMSTTDRADLPVAAFEHGVTGFLSKELLTTASLRAIWDDAVHG